MNVPATRLHLGTCVWGDWHLGILERINWPTLLSPGNLPALAGQFDLVYRIFTTPRDRARIEAMPAFAALRRFASVEFVTPLGDGEPDVTHHVAWYHQIIGDSRSAGAVTILVPPDVAWSDGTFGFAGALIRQGRLAAAMPYLRVIAETCLPDLASFGGAAAGSATVIPPGELVRIAMRHLHPVSAAAIQGSPHGRPSLEMLWRVPGEGLLLRHIVRELFFFDPRRVEISHLWYAQAGCQSEDIHVVGDSDEMMMLSFAPLAKDMFLYTLGRPLAPIAIARQSLHPLNDTPFNPYFGRHNVRLHYGEMTEKPWRQAERRADLAFRQVLVLRESLRLWREAKDRGCRQFAELFALAMQTTALARKWRHDGAVTLLAPEDRAFDALGGGVVERLARPGGEAALMHAILSHLAPGTWPANAPPRTLATSGGRTARLRAATPGHQKADANSDNAVTVKSSTEVSPHRLAVVDRWLGPLD